MKLTFITVSAPAVKYLIKAEERINRILNGILELKIYYAVSEQGKSKAAEMQDDIASADATFLDLMGSPPSVIESVSRGCERSGGQIIPFGASAREYLKLGKFTASSMGKSGDKAPSMDMMKKMQKMAETMGKIMPGKIRDMRNYSFLMKYFQNATEDNIYNMLLLLLKEYGHVKRLPNPKDPALNLPASLYMLPEMEAERNTSKYAERDGHAHGRDNVLLLFSSYAYPTDTIPCVAALHDELSGFCNVYAIGTSSSFHETEKEIRRIIADIEGGISLIMNCCPFRLAAGPMGGNTEAGVNFLKDMDVPYLHPFFMTRRTEKEWRDTIAGCSPTENLLSIMLPELDGSIDTIPVGAMSEPDMDEKYGVETYELMPIEERLKHFAKRVRRYLDLKRKKNGEKRVAIICYNYPPGEANIFGGAFLDTFESVSEILGILKTEGYDVSEMSADELMNVFTAGKAVNSGYYETDWDEAIMYESSKYDAPEEVTSCFGEKPGRIMAEDGKFFIPGIRNKNVFIGLQPARSANTDDADSYHDKKSPPHHQYVAFYEWLKKEFKADAVIHVGTHGTIEFLKGKESGMSGECYPDILIGDLPHIYIYYCGNPSEAVIAKRRTNAELVSYQPPVFVEGGLYGEYEEISRLLESYRQTLSVSPESAQDAFDILRRRADELGIGEDVEGELYRMQHSLIPKGLHIFGMGYSAEEADVYAVSIYEKSLERGMTEKEAGEARDAAKLASMNNCEASSLIRALSGKYIKPGLGGDIYRSPEVLPSGCNLYQFDPRLIPSEAALERGKRIAENTIETYYKEHGKYPESAAVILWGLETSRTQGETIGQILGYLGGTYSKSDIWSRKPVPIPLSELGRPRIDVTINICGFFRDMFPMAIELLDDFMCELYEADEEDEDNYFKKHSRLIEKKLISDGYDLDEAKQISGVRMFGPREGEYGTELTDIISGKAWEDESELGTSFTASLRHAYSRRLHGKKIEGLYEDNLRCVDIVSQLRTNHEYEITDLDHYYEFFGGLAKSVELVKGEKAVMYITDTTGKDALTETVDKSIARGIRTRVLNPKWIDGMLAHKSHGAQKIKDRFENVMGLAATTGAVDEQIYDDLEEKYVKDEDIRKRMADNNPHAYMKILEQMMEYSERGYWNASEEQLQRIKDAYLEVENDLEGTL